MQCRVSSVIYLIALSTLSIFSTQIIARSHKHRDYYKYNVQKVLTRPSPEKYNVQRERFMSYEENRSLGADIVLNENETIANELIMKAKLEELEKGLLTPHLFAPSQHFFSVMEQIKTSKLYEYLAKMPKAGALHVHDTAIASTDFLLELSYRPNLWACVVNEKLQIETVLFARELPTSTFEDRECVWISMEDLRESYGADAVDTYLSGRFTMFPQQQFLDENEAWQRFTKLFAIVTPLVTYEPNWRDYYYRALYEFYNDGVQYVEIRSTLPNLYDLDGNVFDPIHTAEVYKKTVDYFKTKKSDFIGSKLIYAPSRKVSNEVMSEYIETAIKLKETFPDFFAGFDLVAQEALGRPLKDFIPQLLSMPKDIDFYFHAGETNWFGTSIDENLVDAILLGAKRIGHGFAVVKHPLVMKMLKHRNIAIEVNPISNQILQLVPDYRLHPCAELFSDGYPVVISSDDRSFWKADPLTSDYYMAFLGIASAHADLRLLKKLAINSIVYSALDPAEQIDALAKWQTQWDAFINALADNTTESSLLTNRLD